MPLPAALPGLPAPGGPADAAAEQVAAEPGYRLRLALAAAVADGDEAKATELVALGSDQAPGWDGPAELARLRQARRWRRTPALVGWVVRLAHGRRVW